MSRTAAKLPNPFSPITIVAAVVAVMSACVLGLVVWKVFDARANSLAQGERDIRNLAHSLAEHASHSIQAADVVMNGMVDLLKYHRPREDRFNLYLRNTVRTLPQIREIGVLNSEGAWIYSSLDETPKHNNADRDYFIQHRDSSDPSLRISEPLRSRLTGRTTIILSRRISSQDGAFDGVLVAAIDTAYFDNFYKTFKLGPDGGITLLRGDAAVLVRWPKGNSERQPSSAFKARIGSDRSGYTKTVSPFDGLSKYLGYERGSLYPIVVTVALTEEEVLAGWHDGLRNDIIVALILMGMVVMLAAMLWKQFSKRLEIENTLRERESRYRLLADNIADVVIRLDRDGKFLFVSQSVEAILGFNPDDLIGKSCYEFVHPDDLANIAKATSELTDWTTTRSVEFRTYHADRSLVWIEINLKLAGAADGQREVEVVGVMRDVTERHKMEEELGALTERLAELATTDGLTGLSNRRTFDAALPREFRDRKQISLVMLDIDHFKGFNDNLGHQAGDECLRRVSRVIADATENTSALAARYGGEEFAVILPGVGDHDALKVAEAIRLKIRSLAIANPAAPRGLVSISIGIANRTAGMADEAALLGAADQALYEAKRSGRNCCVLSSSLKQETVAAPPLSPDAPVGLGARREATR